MCIKEKELIGSDVVMYCSDRSKVLLTISSAETVEQKKTCHNLVNNLFAKYADKFSDTNFEEEFYTDYKSMMEGLSDDL